MIIFTIASMGTVVLLSAVNSPEGTKLIVIGIIRTGFVGFISKKIMEAIGKEDYGKVIGVTTVSLCGIQGIKIAKNAITTVGKVVDKFEAFGKGVSKFAEGTNKVLDKIDFLNLFINN